MIFSWSKILRAALSTRKWSKPSLAIWIFCCLASSHEAMAFCVASNSSWLAKCWSFINAAAGWAGATGRFLSNKCWSVPKVKLLFSGMVVQPLILFGSLWVGIGSVPSLSNGAKLRSMRSLSVPSWVSWGCPKSIQELPFWLKMLQTWNTGSGVSPNKSIQESKQQITGTSLWDVTTWTQPETTAISGQTLCTDLALTIEKNHQILTIQGSSQVADQDLRDLEAG